MAFNKKDFYFSIITGLITGFVAWQVLTFLNVAKFNNISFAWLMLFIPILWILGVNLGYFLSRWFGFFNQFGKFAVVGFTNAAVYFGILNSLIYVSGFNSGLWYSLFVAGAFIIGTAHSYFWNKFWVFESRGQSVKNELSKFFGVYLIAGLVNTGTASAVVNLTTPLFGLTADQWANVGGIVGSAVALVISFTGVKLAVFRK